MTTLAELVADPWFPFEGDVRVKQLLPRQVPEPDRSGAHPADLLGVRRARRVVRLDGRALAAARRRASRRRSPGIVLLEPREHHDSYADLPAELLAELGPLTARVERALLSLRRRRPGARGALGRRRRALPPVVLPAPARPAAAARLDAAGLARRAGAASTPRSRPRPCAASRRRWRRRPDRAALRGACCRASPSRGAAAATRRCSGCGCATPSAGGCGSPRTATSSARSSGRCGGPAIPMAYSAGFTPHPKVSYAGAAADRCRQRGGVPGDRADAGCSTRPTCAGRPGRVPARRSGRRGGGDGRRGHLAAGPPGGLGVRDPARRGRPGDGRGGGRRAAGRRRGRDRADDQERHAQVRRARRRSCGRTSASERVEARPGRQAVAPCAILRVVVRHTTPAVRPDDVLEALRQVADLAPPVPPQVTRLAQGPLDPATGDVSDPLVPDRA